MQITHPDLGSIDVPDDFWSLSDADKDAAISKGIASNKPSLLNPNQTPVEEEATPEDTATDKDVKAVAEEAVKTGLAELEKFKAKADGASSEILSQAGGVAGRATKSAASSLLGGINKLGANLREGLKERGEAVHKGFEWVVDHQDEILDVGTDVAILAAMWYVPVIPPQYKALATLDTAISIFGFTGPKALEFVKAYAEGLGHPIDPEVLSGLEKSFVVGQYTPKTMMRRFLSGALKQRHSKDEPFKGSLLTDAPTQQSSGGRVKGLF